MYFNRAIGKSVYVWCFESLQFYEITSVYFNEWLQMEVIGKVFLSVSSAYYVSLILTSESYRGGLICASKRFKPLTLVFERQTPGQLPIGDIRCCWDEKLKHLRTQ